MFLVNGKPFLISFHISCGFLKYACIFKATQVIVYKLCIKTTYQLPCTPINKCAHRLLCESKIPRTLITQQEFSGKWFLPGSWRPGKLKKTQMVIPIWECNT